MTPIPAQARGASDLLHAVRTLELAARDNVAGLATGDYATSILGRGLLFHELRRYVSGEPARLIDWNITARLDEPYVRVHKEERQREVFVALDVSPSMHAGFSDKTKLELGVELAATLILSAVEGGDRAGVAVFADRVLGIEPPRSGRGHLFRLLRLLLENTAPWTREVAQSDPRTALHAMQSLRARGLVLFVISDFIDHDIPDDLRYVHARHDVSLLHVYDPLEYSDPTAKSEVKLSARSPEGNRRQRPIHFGETDFGGGAVPTPALADMQGFLRQHAGRHRIAFDSVSTREPVPRALERYFHRRRKLLR